MKKQIILSLFLLLPIVSNADDFEPVIASEAYNIGVSLNPKTYSMVTKPNSDKQYLAISSKTISDSNIFFGNYVVEINHCIKKMGILEYYNIHGELKLKREWALNSDDPFSNIATYLCNILFKEAEEYERSLKK